MTDKDRALALAKELLAGVVCECGHDSYDHNGGRGVCLLSHDDPPCPCRRFKAVRFRVERAPEQP